MRPSQKISLFSIPCIALTACLSVCEVNAADVTVINETAEEVFVSYALHKPSGQMHSTDNFHPGEVISQGWYRVRPYGEIKIPVSANPGYYQAYVHFKIANRPARIASKNKRPFPFAHRAFRFVWKYPYVNGEDGNPWAGGKLTREATNERLEMTDFVPVREIADNWGRVTIRPNMIWR